MSAGFVKLRRGILEHLPDRMTFEEYGIYSLIILNADHRTGFWRGCALALSKQVGKSERWCQRVLASLRRKGYITGEPSKGRGQYMLSVEKYFEKASVVTPSGTEGVCGDTFRPKKASVVTPYQEVKTYKKKREEVNPRKNGATSRSVRDEEQRRRIEAKQKRLEQEDQVRSELYVGSGPVCAVPDLWAEVKALAAKKAL